ncbi:MAG: hypothetical protein K2J44_00570 [Ruminococcus sp.]|nr:hypothetical protein [Ruminococcus sp.]
MAVRKKLRRKITYNNKEYIWYVKEDYDSIYYILNVVSYDKSLVMSVPLKTVTPYVISKGRIFQGQNNINWNRYILPFEVPEIITPKFTALLIRRATENSDAVRVGWNGKDIPI